MNVALLVEVGRARAQRRLHHHLDRDPGRPVLAFHAAAVGRALEARIDLRPAVALPGPVPGDRLEIDRADHRPRAHGLVRKLAGEIEGVVGDEDHVVVAVERGEQQRIVLLALARIGAGLEIALGDDAGAEFLDRGLERPGHGGIGRRRTLQHQDVAPFARHEMLHEAVHGHGEARQRVHDLARAKLAAQPVVRRGGVEQQHVAPPHRLRQRPERFGGRIDDEEMDAAGPRAPA